jgi:hypothetical protein
MNLRRVTNLDLTWFRDGNNDLVDYYNILSRWKNYVSQIFNIYRVRDGMQMKILSLVLLTIDGV